MRESGFHSGCGGDGVWDGGSDEGGDVEGGEDGDAVAETEKTVGDIGDFGGAGGVAGGWGRRGCRSGSGLWRSRCRCRRRGFCTEDAREPGVLVYANPHVHGGGGEEFGGAGEDGREGLIAHGGGEGVNGVRGEVGGCVEGVDKEEWGAEEEAPRLCEHGSEAGCDGLADGDALGCFFDDRAGSKN